MTPTARFCRHLAVLILLATGFCVSHLRAEPQTPTPAVAASSLLDQWLKPDVIIGGALVLLYVGELRGDVRRLKADLAATQTRLHDDYVTKDVFEATMERRS